MTGFWVVDVESECWWGLPSGDFAYGCCYPYDYPTNPHGFFDDMGFWFESKWVCRKGST
jgi:hypothetical protein